MAGFFHGSSGVVYPPQIFWLCAQTVEYLSTRFAVRVQWSCVLHCWFEPGHGLELWAFGWSWITLHFAEQMNLGRSKISQIDFYSCFLVCYRFESWGAHEGLVRGSWGMLAFFHLAKWQTGEKNFVSQIQYTKKKPCRVVWSLYHLRLPSPFDNIGKQLLPRAQPVQEHPVSDQLQSVVMSVGGTHLNTLFFT